jgi:enoyl-CoA hydratase/carnithine racemase
VAVLTLNRPEVHNAFNALMQRELHEVWQGLRLNRDVKAVVWTGAGDQAFCTGIDRGESIEKYLEDPDGQRGTGRVATSFMFNDPGININPKANDLWKPVIAAVNGMACGGALYMLGEADIVIAAEHATFFDPHVSYGMVAGFEAVHLLQKLPLGETLRLAVMGAHERMSADRAYQLGLVSEIVPADRLVDRAVELGQAIAASPDMAIQGSLRAIWMAHETHRRQALAQVSSLVQLGTVYGNIDEGQKTFEGERPDHHVR